MEMAGKEYKQLSCRDVGIDCDFLVRAETEEEVMKYGGQHACDIHGKCSISPEEAQKAKSLIKTVQC